MDTSMDIHRRMRKWEGPLLHYANQFLHRTDSADSAVRSVFLRFLQTEEMPEDDPAPLFRLTRAVCRKGSFPGGGNVPGAVRFRFDPPEGEKPGRPLLREICTLPEAQQEILALRYEYGMTFSKIAEIIGAASDTVGKLLLDAEESLKTNHQTEGGF